MRDGVTCGSVVHLRYALQRVGRRRQGGRSLVGARRVRSYRRVGNVMGREARRLDELDQR